MVLVAASLFFKLVHLDIINLILILYLLTRWLPDQWSIFKKTVFSIILFFAINSFISLFLYLYGIKINTLLITVVYLLLSYFGSINIDFSFKKIHLFNKDDRLPAAIILIVLFILGSTFIYNRNWYFFIPSLGTDNINHFLMYRQAVKYESIVFDYGMSDYVKDLKLPTIYNPGNYINGLILYKVLIDPIIKNNYLLILFNYAFYQLLSLIIFFAVWIYLLQNFIRIDFNLKRNALFLGLFIMTFISDIIFYLFAAGFYSSISMHIYILTMIYFLFAAEKEKIRNANYLLIIINTAIAITWHHLFPITTLLLIGYFFIKNNTPKLFFLLSLLISAIPIFYFHTQNGLVELINDVGTLNYYNKN